MGLGRGWACIGIQITLRLWVQGWGRVGQARAEWGWGGVGHALGSNSIAQDRPSGAAWLSGVCIGIQLNYSKTRPWLQIGQLGGRVWPVRAEWGWGGVGHALGFFCGVGHA